MTRHPHRKDLNPPEPAGRPLYLPVDVRHFTESEEEARAAAAAIDEGYATILIFGTRALPDSVLQIVPDEDEK